MAIANPVADGLWICNTKHKRRWWDKFINKAKKNRKDWSIKSQIELAKEPKKKINKKKKVGDRQTQ